jgi:transposase-like protein
MSIDPIPNLRYEETTMPTATNTHQSLVCPECACKDTIKKGRRRNRFQTLQLFQCIECLHKFTGAPGKNRTYPLKYILEGISTYNLGHSLTETQSRLRKRIRADVPARTLQAWLSAHRPLTTYARLRSVAKRAFGPQKVIRGCRLQHQQVYDFQLHQAKLQLLLETPAHKRFGSLTDYLYKVDQSFPHHLFQTTRHRSSSFPAELHFGDSEADAVFTSSALLMSRAGRPLS